MPSEVPNRILRGFRFATHDRQAADQLIGCISGTDACEYGPLGVADVERELEQLVGASTVSAARIFATRRSIFAKVFDGDFGD